MLGEFEKFLAQSFHPSIKIRNISIRGLDEVVLEGVRYYKGVSPTWDVPTDADLWRESEEEPVFYSFDELGVNFSIMNWLFGDTFRLDAVWIKGGEIRENVPWIKEDFREGGSDFASFLPDAFPRFEVGRFSFEGVSCWFDGSLTGFRVDGVLRRLYNRSDSAGFRIAQFAGERISLFSSPSVHRFSTASPSRFVWDASTRKFVFRGFFLQEEGSLGSSVVRIPRFQGHWGAGDTLASSISFAVDCEGLHLSEWMAYFPSLSTKMETMGADAFLSLLEGFSFRLRGDVKEEAQTFWVNQVRTASGSVFSGGISLLRSSETYAWAVDSLRIRALSADFTDSADTLMSFLGIEEEERGLWRRFFRLRDPQAEVFSFSGRAGGVFRRFSRVWEADSLGFEGDIQSFIGDISVRAKASSLFSRDSVSYSLGASSSLLRLSSSRVGSWLGGDMRLVGLRGEMEGFGRAWPVGFIHLDTLQRRSQLDGVQDIGLSRLFFRGQVVLDDTWRFTASVQDPNLSCIVVQERKVLSGAGREGVGEWRTRLGVSYLNAYALGLWARPLWVSFSGNLHTTQLAQGFHKGELSLDSFRFGVNKDVYGFSSMRFSIENFFTNGYRVAWEGEDLQGHWHSQAPLLHHLDQWLGVWEGGFSWSKLRDGFQADSLFASTGLLRMRLKGTDGLADIFGFSKENVFAQGEVLLSYKRGLEDSGRVFFRRLCQRM